MIYEFLANVVAFIHLVVIAFMLGGELLSKKWRRIKIFHSSFCFMVFILQLVCGLKCPLVILEQRLRQLANPEYVINWTPFTEKIIKRFFGFSISKDIIFVIIAMLAVVGVAQLITIKKLKEDDEE